MPDLIRHPVHTWIPAFAGMTILRYLIAGVIKGNDSAHLRKLNLTHQSALETVRVNICGESTTTRKTGGLIMTLKGNLCLSQGSRSHRVI